MSNHLHQLLTVFIASVWFINGLFCKVLNWVPRHEEIVAAILSSDNARSMTVLIGLSEIAIAIIVISQYKSKQVAVAQIVTVLGMNIVEFMYVQELLLWGRFNAVFAIVFALIVWFNEFFLSERLQKVSAWNF